MSIGEQIARSVVRTIRGKRPFLVRNSLLRNGEKELLSCTNADEFKWYTCGPTVYDDAHLGHARSYVSFDIIRRILTTCAGLRITYAMGVTDIDDKILTRAKERNECPRSLARRYESRFFEDMDDLNVLSPNKILRVTEHIDELQSLIGEIVKSKKAYVTEKGNVYFSVESSGARYGQLDPSRMHSQQDSAMNADPEQDGFAAEKKDRRDFVLWKASDDSTATSGEWDSPWGSGRPGWHIECSAMAMATMGRGLDLHTGGIDLRFPHHTNELAVAEARLCSQNEALHESFRWSHTWLHGGHLHLKGRKMSKSVKNFITVREFLQNGGSADAFRIFCLLHRYWTPVDYSDERLADAESYLSRVRSFLDRKVLTNSIQSGNETGRVHRMHPACEHATQLEHSLRTMEDGIDEAIADDFDTSRVMGMISELVTRANKSLNEDDSPKSGAAAVVHDMTQDYVRRTLSDLGLDVERFGKKRTEDAQSGDAERFKDVMELLVSFRRSVRHGAREKDLKQVFAACDKAREEAQEKFGVRIMDGKQGKGWSET
ncbi:putative cysteine--tRNA ligase, mitochondrial [Gracilariopsis chorda]|uniref:cysteine--tRNA ligase n=1 Tax=Gracilariopsis chorda TaxID=448386 RepID=A0A2V3IC83_9FLOR|nr:putative cysteine--tRNA ligase, mitochondrial [Gracilariopsis chorda]|eukprot:PXF39699.1 putative cysteine--tRNA ligase, mitochondrial [Gracilariopsis chorda]